MTHFKGHPQTTGLGFILLDDVEIIGADIGFLAG